MLAFTSVYFFESGLINGLRPIGVKKNRAGEQLASKLHKTGQAAFPAPSILSALFILSIGNV